MTFSPDLVDVVDDVLSVGMTSAGATRGAAEELFQTVTELGWLVAGIPESAGGSGGELPDLAEIAAGIGRNAGQGPILETATTQWLHAGLTGQVANASPAGANIAFTTPSELRVTAAGDHWILDGQIQNLTWLGSCGYVLVLTSDGRGRTLALVLTNPLSDTTIVPYVTTDILDAPQYDLTLSQTRVPTDRVVIFDERQEQLLERAVCRSALLRSAALVGAAERACSLTALHIRNREQFGAPLARLQVVASTFATAVAERDLMIAAVRRAIDVDGNGPHIAAAAAATSRGAGVIATAAHQLHGAIGITREYPLHLITRRLWTWRDSEGSQRSWEHRVGLVAFDGGESAAWSLVVDSPGAVFR